MKPIHALRTLGLAGLGTLLAAASFAQDAGYYYGGLSVGPSRAKIDQPRITASLLAAGLGTLAMTVDERSSAYKLFGGYQFNPNLALEGGYFNLGKFSFTSTTEPPGSLSGQIRLQGLNLDLVGTLPLSERWSAFGRVGAQYAQARDKFVGSGAVTVLNPNPRKNQTNYKLGLGLQYTISPSILLRGEAERYRINDAVGNHGDVNVVSVTLVFPFGRTPGAAPRAAMEAPVYVAPAPLPAPPPAPVALAPAPPVLLVPPVVVAPVLVEPVVVAPARSRVSFSADSLFAFDQAVVRPDGKTALDRFAQQLKGTEFNLVTVEGHTDRLGSEVYNQRLSSKRAEAVKAYLVDPGGIDGAKISALGKSESTAVTKPDQCKGNRPSTQLIACLQPDRRVDVEVTGTR